MLITLCSLAALFYFYKVGGFSRMIEAAALDEEPEPVQNEVYREPPKSFQTEPEPPKVDRVKLEKIACNCLTASGCKFDVWHYCRNKSDIELMDIIKDYNIYHTE